MKFFGDSVFEDVQKQKEIEPVPGEDLYTMTIMDVIVVMMGLVLHVTILVVSKAFCGFSIMLFSCFNQTNYPFWCVERDLIACNYGACGVSLEIL